MDFKKYARRVAGKKSRNNGATFEFAFQSLCGVQGVNCVRIPDGCKQVGARKLIRVATPFDYCLCYQGRAAFVDTKTTDAMHFTHSMIKPHQLNSLRQLSPGGKAGYVLGMGDGNVYFADVSLLLDVQPGGRVALERAILLGERIAFDVRRIF
jgi:hypothetical protein